MKYIKRDIQMLQIFYSPLQFMEHAEYTILLRTKDFFSRILIIWSLYPQVEKGLHFKNLVLSNEL